MTDDREMTLRVAQLGIEAEAFLRSDLGRYLADRADLEVEQLRVRLEEADPDDKKANRDIRRDIKIRRLVMQWINEAISSGRAANVEIDMDPEELPDD